MESSSGDSRTTRRVLVVDDDQAARDLLATILTDERYEVAAAASGRQAVQLLRAFTPDLVLLDLRLGRADGASFARAYHRLRGPRAPIVIVTAAPSAAERAAELGADGYLEKPFDLDDLLALVERCTGLRSSAGSATQDPIIGR